MNTNYALKYNFYNLPCNVIYNLDVEILTTTFPMIYDKILTIMYIHGHNLEAEISNPEGMKLQGKKHL